MRFAHILKRAGRTCSAGPRLGLLLLSLLVPLAASGCSSLRGVRDYLAYNDNVNDFVLAWRNNVWSRQAWHERQGMFEGQPQPGTFSAGFRAGYSDVAAGGSGCPPPLPPRRYWSWRYQTPEGQAKVAAWFAGYPHGARAAEEEQAGRFQDIQVSYLIEKQYSPEFESGEILNLDAPAEPLDEYLLEPLPEARLLNPSTQTHAALRARGQQSAQPARLPQLSANVPASYLAPAGPHGAALEPQNSPRPTAWPMQ